jgi:hypothetical protein
MNVLIDYLAEARTAHRRHDWRASYAAFERADGIGPMPTDDLDAYSVAAWRIGRGGEAVRLAERTYDRLVRTDPAGAAMTAAVLGLEWHARGHLAVSRQWTDRARRLLAGAPVSGTHGYLAYLDAVTALTARDSAALTGAASALRDLAAETADATLSVLTKVVDGLRALLESNDAEGYRLLDGALLPTLSEQVPLEWAGDVYRLVLRTGGEVDARHRRAWTESMHRWSVTTQVVIEIDEVASE